MPPFRWRRALRHAVPVAFCIGLLHLLGVLAEHHAFSLLGALLAPTLAIATVAYLERVDARPRERSRRAGLLRVGPIVCLLTIVYLAAEWPERELLEGHRLVTTTLLDHWLPLLVSAGIALYGYTVLCSLGALLDYLREDPRHSA